MVATACCYYSYQCQCDDDDDDDDDDADDDGYCAYSKCQYAHEKALS